MPLVSRLGAASSRGFGQFNKAASEAYIEDYFSTYLYNGTGAAQSISNGIGLADTAEWSTIKTQQNSTQTRDVRIDSSGNIVVVGEANDGTRTYGFVVKYNSLGAVQWQRKLYLSGVATRLYDLAINSSGDIYVVGNAQNPLILAKYNSSGALQWQRTLQQTGQSATGRGIILDSSGNVYVAGRGNDGTREVLQFAKYNSSGTLQWQRKIYQGTGTSTGNGNILAVDSLDNVYLTGAANDGTRNYAIIAKYNSSGTIQWQRKYYVATGGGQGITTDSSDNVYVFLLANDGVTGTHRYLLKYNSSGTLQWQRTFGGSSNEAYGVYTDSSANIYCIGRGDDGTGAACQIFKYNSSGTLQWQRGLRESTTWGYQGAVSSDNLFVTGYATSNSVMYGFTSRLKTDGTTQSGTAFLTLFTTVEPSATGTGTDAAGTATDEAGTATDAAGTFTDEAGTTTSSLATQVAVSGAGGLVWMKSRSASADHALYDTIRGTTKQLVSNLTSGETTESTGLTAFNANGFTIGTLSTINTNAATYSSWTFRKQPKFFDVITYTGNGANRTISHNLGSVPGMIIIKRTDTTGAWAVYHRSLANTEYLVLNTTAAKATGTTYWNSTTPTSTVFSLGTATDVNANGGTYVAYLFAHDAGGFGADGSQNVISCGSFTTDGSGNATISLGYEPQLVMFKASSTTGSWRMYDNMRGIATGGNDAVLYANLSAAEDTASNAIDLNATGFSVSGQTASATYIYMAIRRGPMKVPTNAANVFNPSTATGVITTGFPVDWNVIGFRIGSSLNSSARTRLTGGGPYLVTSSTAAQTGTTNIGFDSNTGLKYSMAPDWINWNFQRAPCFFDIACYTGTGSARTVSHNLGVAPELMIVKRRDTTGDWQVYAGASGEYLVLNTTAAKVSSNTDRWNNTAPTSTVFSLGTNAVVNASGGTYVAYLFATCAGISKVGSYTGTGTTQQIDCGFTAGARFVLIKRTDTTGDWYVYDSARGIVAGNDPYLLLNSTAAEVTNTDYVDAYSAGFELSSTAPAGLNANGGTYIFLAIA